MFQFNLQALLDARQSNEERKQRELAEALRDLEVQADLLAGIQERRRQMITEYYDLEGQSVKGVRLALYSENIAMYREREVVQQENCRQAERIVEERRLALIEAAKQRKIIEKFKEKKSVEYLQELNRKEHKELDEAAILRYGGNPL